MDLSIRKRNVPIKQGHLAIESVKNDTNYIKQNATHQEDHFNSLYFRLFMTFFVQDSIYVCKNKKWNLLHLLGRRGPELGKKGNILQASCWRIPEAEHRGISSITSFFHSFSFLS